MKTCNKEVYFDRPPDDHAPLFIFTGFMACAKESKPSRCFKDLLSLFSEKQDLVLKKPEAIKFKNFQINAAICIFLNQLWWVDILAAYFAYAFTCNFRF